MKNCIQKSLISLCLFILPFFCVGQNDNNKLTTIDSIKQVIAESTVDSTIINSLVQWSELVRVSDPDSAKVINEKIVSLCNDIISNKEVTTTDISFYKKTKAKSYNELGSITSEHGDFNKALVFHEEALELFTAINNNEGIADSKFLLGNYYYNVDIYNKALSLFQEAILIYDSIGNESGKASCLNGLGLIHDNQGDYAQAIKYYLECLKITEKQNDKSGAAQTLNNIGVLYLSQNDLDKSLEYHLKALKVRKELGTKYGIAQSLNNIGLIYEYKEDYDTAFEYYTGSYEINKEAEIKSGMSFSLTNLGILYYWKKDLDKAINYHLQSLQIRKEIGDISGVASSNHDIAITYQGLGNCQQSLKYCNLALEIAEDIGFLEIQGGALLTLYECHKQLGNQGIALNMYEKYVKVKDSLENKANQREVLKQELTYTYEKQTLADSLKFVQQQQLVQSELKVKQQQSYFLLGGLALALLFLGFIFKQKKLVETEKNKSDKLLLNILPEETAQELKEKGLVEAKSYNDTSILFTDFIGFSAIAEQLNPKELLHELNYCFSAFDTIMKNHGIEKIKTIGDSYMAASGVPNENNNHAEDAIQAAFEINRFMQDYMKNRKASNLPYFECRIGVNSGPLIAGVVGTQKFQYDVWGDTVNVASRMESKGESGKINISDSTYQLVKDNPKYHFVSRGVIRVKGGRDLDMYFISEQT